MSGGLLYVAAERYETAVLLALLSKRLRLWLLLAVGAPLLAWLLGMIGTRMEHRNGPTRLSQALCRVGGWVDRRAVGPLAHRQEHAEPED